MPKSVFTDAYALVVDALIALRRQKGVSQVELARRLNRPQPFVSYVENRERRLDVIEFRSYVQALGGDPIELLDAIYKQLPPDTHI